MSWLAILDRCPRCGTPRTGAVANPFRCPGCDLTLFANVGVGAGVFAADAAGRVLFVRRAREPSKGLLGVPGGFVDAGESAEQALAREVREEIGATLGSLRFLCSYPNRYDYAGVAYDVCDLFFAGTLAPGALTADPDEVSSLVWLEPAAVRLEELAFPSTRAAWTAYLAG
jgi:ADP-ribose pyrophosphatase YjhB (NUDIX family)